MLTDQRCSYLVVARIVSMSVVFCLLPSDKTWKQTFHVVAYDIHFRLFIDEMQPSLAAITHTGRNHDCKCKIFEIGAFIFGVL